MFGDDWASLAYYVTLLVLLGSALVVEFSGRGGQAIRQLALWGVIFAGVTFGTSLWFDWQSQPSFGPGGRIEIPIGRDGHFHLTAEVDGVEIDFLIDTGASMIVLSRQDTQSVGIDPDQLSYLGRARTANGIVRTAPVTINEFRVGEIVDHDVVASVNEGELDASLLGMSYLSRFARVSFEGDLLVLER